MKSLYVKLCTDFGVQFCIPLVGLVMEQAATIKTFVKAGKKPQKVISLLKVTYGDNALSVSTHHFLSLSPSFDKHFDSCSLLHQSHQGYAKLRFKVSK